MIEKGDFASGTSSRSTKLIHGGLRYLQNLEFKLVHEVGKERSLIHHLVPHLAVPEKMLLPLTRKGKYGRLDSTFGLWFYDLLAAVPYNYRKKMLTKKQALLQEPMLPQDGLLGAGLYTEFRTDDARLTLEVMKTAVRFGATCINYCSFDEFLLEEQKITGVIGSDRLSGESMSIRSRIVVNATGPWVDLVRSKNETIHGKRLHLTKGIHIVVSHLNLPLKQSVYFDVPDGRMIFAIPRQQCTYIGTTDTDYHGNPDQVQVEEADIQYLLKAVNTVFPQAELKPESVISSWAGLRPLIHEPGKSASEISRKDEIFESPNGLISIAGGKLTGYRVMARKTVDLVIKRLKTIKEIKTKPCQTRKIPPQHPALKTDQEVRDLQKEIALHIKSHFSQPNLIANYLVSTYGIQANVILDNCKWNAQDNNLALLKAELTYCKEEEWCHTAEDFFDRRTARKYFDPESVDRYAEILQPDFF